MQLSSPIDIHTVVFEADLRLLELQIFSVVRFIDPAQVSTYRININGSMPAVSEAIREQIESRILPRIAQAWREKIELPVTSFGHPRGGPRSQQVLKLTSVASSAAPYVLVVDAKNHFLRPTSLSSFFADDGRIKTVIKKVNSGFEKAVSASFEFFGARYQEGDNVLPTITPYVMMPEIVRNLLADILLKTGESLDQSFDKDRLLRESTEFYLYNAFMARHGLVESHYTNAPQTFLSLFTVWPQDRKVVANYLERAANDPTCLMFGLHRLRLPQLNNDERAKFAELWRGMALPEPASYYLEPFPWPGDPVSTVSQSLPCIVQSQGGLQLLLDPTSHVDRYLIKKGAWEAAQIQQLFDLANKLFAGRDDVAFIDIGSFWGLYALLAWKSGFYTDVIAFEADPYNYSQLMAQMFLNRASYDIDVRHLAVSDHAGQIKMMRSTLRGDGNRGTASVLPEETHTRHSVVRCARLDDELSSLQERALVVKIDVEGHELQALRGMTGLLAANAVLMQIELYDTDASVGAKELLVKCGYREVGRIGPDHYFTNLQ